MVTKLKGVKARMKDGTTPADVDGQQAAREVAGRPKIMKNGKRFQFWIDAEDIRRANLIGDGNTALGIRRAISRYRVPDAPQDSSGTD